jgi:hypothetical protein
MTTIPPNPYAQDGDKGTGERERSTKSFTKVAINGPWGGLSTWNSQVTPVAHKTKENVVVIAGYYDGLRHGTNDERRLFDGRAEKMAGRNGHWYKAHTGTDIARILEEASKNGPITKLVILSHGANDGVYMTPAEGLYSTGYADEEEAGSKRVADIIAGIKDKKILIADNAQIVVTMCNGAADHPKGSFIEDLSGRISNETTVRGVRVYGASGKANPVTYGNSDTNAYRTDGKWYVALDGKKKLYGSKFLNPAALK